MSSGAGDQSVAIFPSSILANAIDKLDVAERLNLTRMPGEDGSDVKVFCITILVHVFAVKLNTLEVVSPSDLLVTYIVSDTSMFDLTKADNVNVLPFNGVRIILASSLLDDHDNLKSPVFPAV